MIKLMEMVKYRHIRPFTKVEMNQITDEYLNNNKFKEVMPNFAKDKDDVLTKLQKINEANEMAMKYISLKMKQAHNDSKIISSHFVYFNGQMQTNIIEGTRAFSAFE